MSYTDKMEKELTEAIHKANGIPHAGDRRRVLSDALKLVAALLGLEIIKFVPEREIDNATITPNA